MSNQKKAAHGSKNTLETLSDFGSSFVKNSAADVKKLGTGMFDQFFGTGAYADRDKNTFEHAQNPWGKEKQATKPKREFSLFKYQEYYEKELIKKEIKELTEQIKKEIELLKKADASLLSDIKDIQKIGVEELPEKPGIYHIRFLEIILSILRNLRAKVGESRTWLAAMVSKRKKRGSLFGSLSKKKGTQYSLSQELQASRSVQ